MTAPSFLSFILTKRKAEHRTKCGWTHHAELWAKVGDGMKGVRRRIVVVFEASTFPSKEDTP
jgi:hypothetical protein